MKLTVLFKASEEIRNVNTLDVVHAWIYENLFRKNRDLGEWLHNQGIFCDKKVMKPFNFSPLFKTKKERVYGIKLSSQLPSVQHAFVEMLNDATPLIISNGKKIVLDVIEVKMKRLRDTKVFFTLSPILLKDREGFVVLDLNKEEDVQRAKQIIQRNLQWKYKALFGKEDYGQVEFFQPKKMKVFYTSKTMNGKKVYYTGLVGSFILVADYNLVSTAYYHGIGYLTGCGFGCIEVESKR